MNFFFINKTRVFRSVVIKTESKLADTNHWEPTLKPECAYSNFMEIKIAGKIFRDWV